jgi:hypothetical protein
MKSVILSEIPSWFRVYRHKARTIPYKDCCRLKGKVNPYTTTCFFDNFSNNEVIWDPFAGDGISIDLGLEKGLRVLAQDIVTDDDRVLRLDSTKFGPKEKIDGILFHPPYYGTGVFSLEASEIGSFSKDDYLKALMKVVELGVSQLESGYVLAVGSSYLSKGKKIDLDWWLASLFLLFGFKVVELWSSVPDIGVLLRR